MNGIFHTSSVASVASACGHALFWRLAGHLCCGQELCLLHSALLNDTRCTTLQVKEPRVLYGGGWPEMRMARAIEEAAKKTPGE